MPRWRLDNSKLEGEILWFDTKAYLLETHDNIAYIVESYCIELLIILEFYEKAHELKKGVLDQMESGKYLNALDNVQDFVLGDSAMFKMFPWLVDKVEPGLNKLNQLANEFDIS